MSLVDRIRNRAARALEVQPAPAPVVPEVRADAATTIAGSAAIANELSGLGTPRDSGASARPVPRYDLTEEELIYAFRGALYRRICELMPRWATKKGAKLTDDTDDDAPLADELKRLGVMDVFRRADTWAACLGEARVLIVTDDPTPWSEPLNPRNISRIKRLEVLDRREFSVATYNKDVDADDLGWPETYYLHPRRPVAFPTDEVHASRLLRFWGNDLPPSELAYSCSSTSGWGADALGQVLWDGIRNLSQLGAAGAHIAQQLSVAVFHVDAIKAKTGGPDREATMAKFSALSNMMSVMRAVFLGKNESMERVAANPSGFGDLSEDARLQLALVTGRPMTLLFGEAPGGLNTDGDSWKEIWYGDVAAHQEERYRDPLEYLIRLLYLTERGGIPDTWALEFNALQELTRMEKAQARLVETQADSNEFLDGVITIPERRGRYTVPEGYGGLQPLEEVPETPPTTEPEPTTEQKADASDPTSACVLIPLSEAAKARWLAVVELAEAIVGPMEREDYPHVTAFFAGPIADGPALDLEGIVGRAAKEFAPIEAQPDRVGTLGSEERPAIVLHLGGWGLDALPNALSRRAGYLTSTPPHDEYRPHVTLGYVDRELTPEEVAGLADIPLPREWTLALAVLQLSRGGTIKSYPLSGARRDSGD